MKRCQILIKEKKYQFGKIIKQNKFTGNEYKQKPGVEETITHDCEVLPGQHLTRSPETFNSIALFLDKGIQLTEAMKRQAEAFSAILSRIARDVFQVDPSTWQMFVDVDGCRVAYNHGGCIFFNLRYFYQCQYKRTSDADVTIFWTVVCCHEFAHNEESGHNAAHEDVLERSVMHFCRPLAQLVASMESKSHSIVPSSPPSSPKIKKGLRRMTPVPKMTPIPPVTPTTTSVPSVPSDHGKRKRQSPIKSTDNKTQTTPSISPTKKKIRGAKGTTAETPIDLT